MYVRTFLPSLIQHSVPCQHLSMPGPYVLVHFQFVCAYFSLVASFSLPYPARPFLFPPPFYSPNTPSPQLRTLLFPMFMKLCALTRRGARLTKGGKSLAGILTSSSPCCVRALRGLGVAMRKTGQTTGSVGKRLPCATRSGGVNGAWTVVTCVRCRGGPWWSRGGFDRRRGRVPGYGRGEKVCSVQVPTRYLTQRMSRYRQSSSNG